MEKRKTNNVPLDDDLNVWYQTNNIIFEKNELYYDFFCSLFDLMEETYLGKDILNDEPLISKHFEWCYIKTVENFEKEKIYFNRTGPLYDYLWFFFYRSYYNEPTFASIRNLCEFFDNLFDFTRVKTSNEQDTYKFLYKLFEMSLKN